MVADKQKRARKFNGKYCRWLYSPVCMKFRQNGQRMLHCKGKLSRTLKEMSHLTVLSKEVF